MSVSKTNSDAHKENDFEIRLRNFERWGMGGGGWRGAGGGGD